MSSPADEQDDDAAPVDSATTAPDPALSYPRGNRLGLRHPRPTVVIVVAVLLVVGVAWAWSAVRAPESEFCDLAVSVDQPLWDATLAESPEDAFELWWAAGGPDHARTSMARALGRPVDAPSRVDFEPTADRAWMWRIDDTAIKVTAIRAEGTASAFRVAGLNDCFYERG